MCVCAVFRWVNGLSCVYIRMCVYVCVIHSVLYTHAHTHTHTLTRARARARALSLSFCRQNEARLDTAYYALVSQAVALSDEVVVKTVVVVVKTLAVVKT